MANLCPDECDHLHLPTDQDLITGHPFQGTGLWGDKCELEDADGWICGYSRSEHADPGSAAIRGEP